MKTLSVCFFIFTFFTLTVYAKTEVPRLLCPLDGKAYDVGIKFCPKHGKELVPDEVYCPEGGERFSGENVFCPEHGKKLIVPTKLKDIEVPANNVTFGNIEGFFVENSIEGQLFVIEGTLTHRYTHSVSSLSVKGILYGANGQVLKSEIAFCGSSVSRQDLKSLPLSEIKDMTQKQLLRKKIIGDTSSRFVVVFSDLKEDLAEFAVEPGTYKR